MWGARLQLASAQGCGGPPADGAEVALQGTHARSDPGPAGQPLPQQGSPQAGRGAARGPANDALCMRTARSRAGADLGTHALAGPTESTASVLMSGVTVAAGLGAAAPGALGGRGLRWAGCCSRGEASWCWRKLPRGVGGSPGSVSWNRLSVSRHLVTSGLRSRVQGLRAWRSSVSFNRSA